MSSDTIKAGDVFVVTNYPFVRSTYSYFEDERGVTTLPIWVPGVGGELISYEGDTQAICHGYGKQIYTVVDTFKPGKYPERVFFTRQWVDPDGKTFGKTHLHITVTNNFRRLIKGYGCGRYDIEQPRLRVVDQCKKDGAE